MDGNSNSSQRMSLAFEINTQMAKTLIDRIKTSLAKEGLSPRTNAARTWLRSKVKDLSPSASSLMKDRTRLKDKSMIGRMYFYFYDPKHKDTLPYYDRFPLVIPIERYSDGFLGLNLHYIHPKQRIIMLQKLSEVASNDQYNEKTKLIFLESVGNPSMGLADISAIAEIANRHDIVLIVDNTVTPLSVQPLALGADIVVYSTTKVITGNAATLGGAVVFRAIRDGEDKLKTSRYAEVHPFINKVGAPALIANAKKRALRDFGMSAHGFGSYVTLLGLETLPLRMDRIVDTVEFARENRITHISLNFAAFRSLFERAEKISAGPVVRTTRNIIRFFSNWFQVESLYRFNAKFQPQWRTRYVLYPKAKDLVNVAWAALRAERFISGFGRRGN